MFFKEDVSPELQSRPLYLEEKDNEEPAAEKYRIGPVVEKQYWFNEPVEGDRGPCKWLGLLASDNELTNRISQGLIWCLSFKPLAI